MNGDEAVSERVDIPPHMLQGIFETLGISSLDDIKALRSHGTNGVDIDYDDNDDEKEEEMMEIEITPTISIKLRTAEDEFNKEKKTLFATHLWNASRVLSKYLVEHVGLDISLNSVIELG